MLIHAQYPAIQIGEIFPVGVNGHGFSVEEALNILDLYQKVNGEELGLVHIEPQFQDGFDPAMLKPLQSELSQRRIPFGILLHGLWDGQARPSSNQAWRDNVIQQAALFAIAGVQPDQIVIQSWVEKPDQAVPDWEPYTFTNTVKEVVSHKTGNP